MEKWESTLIIKNYFMKNKKEWPVEGSNGLFPETGRYYHKEKWSSQVRIVTSQMG